MTHGFYRRSLMTALLILIGPWLPGVTASAQSAGRRTVVDYYLLLPDRYTYGVPRPHRKELLNNEGRIVAKDIENGYLEISGDAGDPGITVALFKLPDGEYLVGVSVFNEMAEDLYFLRHQRGGWREVTRSVVPGFDKSYEYRLPRYGTTVEVRDGAGRKLYDLLWSGGKFVMKPR